MAPLKHGRYMEAPTRGNPKRGEPDLPSAGGEEQRADWYWHQTRRPMPSLVFVLPLMLAYELTVVWKAGASSGSLRTGADSWLRQVLGSAGGADPGALALLVVVGFFGWAGGGAP